MDVDLFDFTLPETHIALRPLGEREKAKLLHVKSDGSFASHHVSDLLQLLTPNDVLVFNDTKVIPAALRGKRYRGETSVNVQAMLHRKEDAQNWWAFVRPAKRLHVGERIIFHKQEAQLEAVVKEKTSSGDVLLGFAESGAKLGEALALVGEMPLPPYIARRRAEDAQDVRDYQTVFAQKAGAVAAPTAGLHYTQDLLEGLRQRGVSIFFVTLHVGAGTFLPVKVQNTDDHKMHAEVGELPAEVAKQLNTLRAAGKRIIAVGTTALRLLESAATPQGKLKPWAGETDIFIVPGYQFRVVDGLLTNFHLPKSTLFMLVSAFCGLERMQKAYSYAIKNNYRFYSYGDTSFLERPKT